MKISMNLEACCFNVENLTKSVNRKWISNTPEIESHIMGPCVDVVYQISKGCDK
jgi:hypothetical protein